jgi:undecaprenyl-diphosphatase
MLDRIVDIDKHLFLFLNGIHNSFFDNIMLWCTLKYTWIPFYAFLLFLIIKTFGKKTYFVILFVLILITISDQLSAHLIKNIFERLRPCHEPKLSGLIHLVSSNCGGKYGFVSSHATNSTALATFLILIIKPNRKYLNIILILYAFLVSYSRIYVGVHYPADIIFGALLGYLTGYVLSYIFNRFINNNRLSIISTKA